MKFPDFSSRGKQRLPGIKCLPIWSTQQSLFHINENRVRPDGQLFNSWGCNSWGKGTGCPPPQPTKGSGECHKLPQRGPGWSPGWKTSFGVFRAWKNTPDFTSRLFPFPFSVTFPWPLWNSLTFPGFPGEWSPCQCLNPVMKRWELLAHCEILYAPIIFLFHYTQCI